MEHIGKQVKILSNLMRREFENSDAQREDRKLTRMHGWVIGYLYDNRGRDVFQRDIEEFFSIRRPTATGILSLMEENGLIRRTPMESDRRLKKLTLTEKAVKLHEQVVSERNALEQKLRKNLSEADIRNFFRIISTMQNNLLEASLPDSGGTNQTL